MKFPVGQAIGLLASVCLIVTVSDTPVRGALPSDVSISERLRSIREAVSSEYGPHWGTPTVLTQWRNCISGYWRNC